MLKPFKILILIGLLSSAIANASTFSNFYVLGDSLSDIGNNPNAIYGGNKMTDWTQFLAADFGQTITASSDGGNSYAYGGARSDYTSPGRPDPNQGMLSQLDELLSAHPTLDGDALYAVWIGPNDILINDNWLITPAEVIATEGAANITEALQELHDAGANYILLGNMPNISLFPGAQLLTPNDRELIEMDYEAYNSTVAADVNKMGFDVIQVDDAGLFQDIFNRPEAFGFQHTSDATCKALGPSNCGGYLFYDDWHPTTAGQKVIADYNYSILTAPDYYATLAEVPFNINKNQNNVINSQIKQESILNTLDQPHIFINSNYTPYATIPRQNDQADNNNNGISNNIGVLLPFGKNNIAGTMLEFTHLNTHLSDNNVNNSYNYASNIAALFLFDNYQIKNFYITGTADYGYINYDDIKRTAMLGPEAINTHGDTNGWQYGLAIDTGYLFQGYQGIQNTLRTGPVVNAAYQKVSVNGYTENGNTNENYAQIAYNDQHSTSLITGIGWQLDFKRQTNSTSAILTTHIYATDNQEWLDKDRDIGFHVVSLDGSHGVIPYVTSDVNYLETGVTTGITFSNSITASLSYVGDFGSADFCNNNISLILTRQF